MLGVSGLEMSKAFYKYHPFINFYYFTFVIVCSMFFTHPAFILISLILSFVYSIYLLGKKSIKFNVTVQP